MAELIFKNRRDLSTFLYSKIVDLDGYYLFLHWLNDFYDSGSKIFLRNRCVSWSDILVFYLK